MRDLRAVLCVIYVCFVSLYVCLIPLQYTDGEEIAKQALFRQLPRDAPNATDEDGPYSNPVFHSMLRASFKTKRSKFTAYDVAMIDTLAWCVLQSIDMHRFPDIESVYDKAARVSMQNIGEHQATLLEADGRTGTTTIVIVEPAGIKTASVRCVPCMRA